MLLTCSSVGKGFPCNKVCGNKIMYGGPSRGGTPSSIGRKAYIINIINRQSYVNYKNISCPPLLKMLV